ncbi:hypothetical protein HYV79_04445 [Candidatus Woesearchaeota archaeon]|nr:hypothetical protein [Candidatus Woesearchaeota archaeon]
MEKISMNNYQDIIKSINSNDLGSEILQNVKLDKNNFGLLQPTGCQPPTTFIDGGNGEIIGAANFTVQKIKIAAINYEGVKRLNRNLRTFTVLITKNKGFNIKILELNQERFFPEESCSPQAIALKLRKQLEIEAMHAYLSRGIVIRDGDLISEQDFEKNIFDLLYKFAEEKNTVIAGLAKTCTLTTNTGTPCTVALQKITKLPIWVYKTNTITNFVKLNKHSKYVFRIDCNKLSEELLSVLVHHAKDISFPGYPYGLIEADKFARVTEQECKQEKLLILAKHEELLEPYLNTINAHDLL